MPTVECCCAARLVTRQSALHADSSSKTIEREFTSSPRRRCTGNGRRSAIIVSSRAAQSIAPRFRTQAVGGNLGAAETFTHVNWTSIAPCTRLGQRNGCPGRPDGSAQVPLNEDTSRAPEYAERSDYPSILTFSAHLVLLPVDDRGDWFRARSHDLTIILRFSRRCPSCAGGRREA
jgi:hypothetical protein